MAKMGKCGKNGIKWQTVEEKGENQPKWAKIGKLDNSAK